MALRDKREKGHFKRNLFLYLIQTAANQSAGFQADAVIRLMCEEENAPR